MASKLKTFRFRRRTYLIETVEESDAYVLVVRFVLHGPGGRRFLLVPETLRPDRLVAIAPITHFSRFRPTPFGGRWLAVEDGKLVIASPDA